MKMMFASILNWTIAASIVFGAFICVPTNPLSAEWIKDTKQNMPVCTAPEEQHFPDLVSDGEGGFIVAWHDARHQNRDVFAQRISDNGEMLWRPDGVPVCDLPSPQSWPIVLTDGKGGAIIVFGDSRHRNQDIYAQRLDPNGNQLWGAEGAPVCTDPALQDDVNAIADGEGGVIVVWEDWRNNNQDIYAQRIGADGKPVWDVNGVPVYRGDGDQYDPRLTTDGAGGTIVVWHDISTPDLDIFAQRLDATGAQAWGETGVPVSTAVGNQGGPFAVSDGNGGAYVIWSDYRNDPNIFTSADIYGQRLDATGQPLWEKDGIGICNDPGNQQQPDGISDGAGGLILTWWDERDIFSDIYAARVLPDGSPAWQTNGLPVCAAEGEQRRPRPIPDGAQGVIVYWQDYREDYGETTVDAIYAQRITADGKALWALNGIPVSNAGGEQRTPQGIADGTGGGFIVWSDERNEAPDIYMQRIP